MYWKLGQLLQIGAALFYYKLGQSLLAASLIQIGASVVTNSGNCCKLGHNI